VNVTLNVTLFDVPPPGVGVKTVTGTERAEARSAAVMAAVSCVVLTTVVVRSAPFQRTTEDVTNPLPFTVSGSAALPAAAVAGERLPITGTGAGASGGSTRVLSNLAVTAVLAVIVHVHAVVPLQAPPQPMKVEPEAAVAVRVTGAPMGSAVLQLLPHEMPAGVLVTVPAPVPAVVTESAAVGTAMPVPVSTREAVSPLAAKVTLPAKVPAAVGRKRTVTT
jgi:hypothetical protein